ncbi:MAG: beta-ketoacyl synthase N-terminal-like domain-containing protein [Polyangiaceae bacterium]
MDPAQRLALECVWEALERAGIPPAELKQSPTGVYLGTVYSDYEPWGGSRGMAGMDGYGYTGRDGSVLSGRVSYAGPSGARRDHQHGLLFVPRGGAPRAEGAAGRRV